MSHRYLFIEMRGRSKCSLKRFLYNTKTVVLTNSHKLPKVTANYNSLMKKTRLQSLSASSCYLPSSKTFKLRIPKAQMFDWLLRHISLLRITIATTSSSIEYSDIMT